VLSSAAAVLTAAADFSLTIGSSGVGKRFSYLNHSILAHKFLFVKRNS
jgi:hypothetical protein